MSFFDRNTIKCLVTGQSGFGNANFGENERRIRICCNINGFRYLRNRQNDAKMPKLMPKVNFGGFRIVFGVTFGETIGEEELKMRKKNYRGVGCTKRELGKCEGVCRTYDKIQTAFADILQANDNVVSFKCNVLLDELTEGEYTSDLVDVKTD